jgi:hypothetical protein
MENLERDLAVIVPVDREHGLREAATSKWTDELISVGDQRGSGVTRLPSHGEGSRARSARPRCSSTGSGR